MRPPGSLRLKLALSHLAVLLLAVGITVAANYFFFRRGFDQRMLEETRARAGEAARALSAVAEADLARRHEVLDALSAAAPVKFSLVPLSAPSEKGPGFFHFPLSGDQLAILRQGSAVSGEIDASEPGRGHGHFCAAPLEDGQSAVVAYAVRMKAPLGKNVLSWIVHSLWMALLPAAGLALLVARHLVHPIETLQEATARVARGDYSARSPYAGRSDELGAMCRDFDRMAEKLETDYQIRTRLLGDISHELGTPVTTLRVTAEALLDGLVQEPDDLQTCHRSILRQVEHLSYLVSDVTELARYETGKVSMVRRPFPALDPLGQACDSARMTAYQRGSYLEMEGDAGGQAIGDPRRLLQVLKNLIHNAIDHNPEGTRVWASCRREGDQMVYRVEDDGPPIPVEQRDAIFERFTKLDLSRPRGPGGGGLGLSIVREILGAHGSRVQVIDTVRGKAFRFTLPAI